MIACMICDKQLKRVTASHLKQHNITVKEYSVLFPDASLFIDELRHAYGKSFRENNPMHNSISKQKVIDALTGISKSEEHRKNLSISRTGKSWGNHTEEHKERMIDISRKSMIERLATGWRPPKWTEERKEKAKLSMLGNKLGKGISRKGVTLNLSQEQRLNRSRKRCEFIATNKTKSAFTKIELQCMEYMNTHGIAFIHQYKLDTEKSSWLFDFYVPEKNLLIEVDGEYWHTKPKQINRDFLKTAAAKDYGFILLRLSDLDLNFSMIFEDAAIIEQWSNNILERRQKKSP
jgi:very-short-patch-repair endonuclease